MDSICYVDAFGVTPGSCVSGVDYVDIGGVDVVVAIDMRYVTGVDGSFDVNIVGFGSDLGSAGCIVDSTVSMEIVGGEWGWCCLR